MEQYRQRLLKGVRPELLDSLRLEMCIRDRPSFSRYDACLSALSTMPCALAPYFCSISFSIEPEFTPMRTGTWCCFRQSASLRTFSCCLLYTSRCV